VEIFLGALLLATATIVVGGQIVTEMKRQGAERGRDRQLSIATLFAPALAQVQDNPKALLAWQPLAKILRAQFPEEFAALDAAGGSTFPFSKDVIGAAHSKWTTEWLAWERTHDATYKLKTSEAEHGSSGIDPAVVRARVDAIEREKLDVYQRRYEEYTRVAKALQNL
jgi:hypothetical protein